jgi:leucyl-tRNA synthetase
MVPHAAEELWEALGNRVPLALTAWPDRDQDALAKETVVIVVQVNGKVRGRVEVTPDAGEERVRDAALADPNVVRFLEGGSIAKAVYVPGRILNLVVR